MIEGIRVLSQSPVIDYDYKYWYIALGGVIGAIAVGLLIGALTQEFDFAMIGAFIGTIVGCFAGLFAVEETVVETNTGRNEYKVLIEDDVEMKEFYERYNIIEQDGEIWIIEDKEINE